MRKKFSAIIVCFLIILACTLSGCAGFYRDDVKYYNKVAIKVGDYAITQFDLDNAYNTYSQYVSMGIYDEATAREMAEESLVNGRLLYEYIKNEQTYQPTEYQLNEIAKSIIDSTLSQMDSYLTTARNIFNVAKAEDSAEDEQTETTYSLSNYKKYTHRAILVENDGSYAIEYNQENDAFKQPTLSNSVIDRSIITALKNDIFNNNLQEQYIKAIISEFKTELKLSLKNETKNLGNDNYIYVGDAIYEKAISLLCDDLVNYEYYLRTSSGKAYSKTQDDLLFRYFKRNVENQIQNQFINNLRTNYLQTRTDELSTQKLVDYWENIIGFNKQYDTDQEGYKTKMKGIGTDGDTVLYHPVLDDDTHFGYFIHILLESEGFSDAVKAAGENKTDLNTAVANMRFKIRKDDGTMSEDTISINEFMNLYNNVAKLQRYEDRLNSFIELMFRYSSDPGLLSGGMPYVVGTNGNSNMNEPFTNEAVALMSGEVGNKINYPNGVSYAGNMSEFNSTQYDDLCIALNSDGEYGIHLIMFIDDVGAYDVGSNGLSVADLGKPLHPLTHETYFDMLFDKVYPAISDSEPYTSNNGYSNYEEILIENSKQTNKVVYYKK